MRPSREWLGSRTVCRAFLSGITLGVAFAAAGAQPTLSFSGYVVDFPSYQRLPAAAVAETETQRGQFLNITRLRLRPALGLWTDAQFSLEYEVSAAYHSASYAPASGTAQGTRQLVDLTWNPVNNAHFSLLHTIDRLHFTFGLGRADLVIGRQRIAWGTGRIWNPTDLFNPINPTAFAKIEKDGVDALLLKISLGSFTDCSLVYNPQDRWRENNFGIRFRTNYEEFDFSLVGGRFDRKVVVGGDFAGNLFDAGVRGEAIANLGNGGIESRYFKAILGADFQFTPELYAVAEYHFNGEGKRERAAYELDRLAAGDILNLGRHYLALSGSYLVHPLISVSSSLTSNLLDGSCFLNASVRYSASDEVALDMGGFFFFADEQDEFGHYPATLFLRAEVYF